MKTVEEIEDYLRSHGVSGKTAVMICRLIKEFATADAFFSAKRSDIEKAYNRITPDNKYGLGAKTWDAFNKALAFYKGFCGKREEVPVEACGDSKNEVRNKNIEMIPYEVMKKIVDMMELLDVEAINLAEMTEFLRNVRFRQKKPAEVSHEASASGE